MRIAYLGPNGSFTHQIAQTMFQTESLVAYETITEVLKAYEQKEVRYAVVPVENSIEGSVHETIDYLFHQASIHAIAEIHHPIQQCLLASSLEKEIEIIYSHPQAIAQGKNYIRERYPNATIEITTSTAAAAKFVSENPDKPYGAIASRAAAKEYSLAIVAEDIQEIDENNTRFWVMGEKTPVVSLEPRGRRISLAVTLPKNGPGALYQAMSVFSWRKIDLTKIESRPLKTVLGEYFFIIDAVNNQEELVQFALKELTSLNISYKILGNYLVYDVK